MELSAAHWSVREAMVCCAKLCMPAGGKGGHVGKYLVANLPARLRYWCAGCISIVYAMYI